VTFRFDAADASNLDKMRVKRRLLLALENEVTNSSRHRSQAGAE
jgi:hypothetical protein